MSNMRLIFGDGIFGKALEDGNIVEVSYIISNGPDGTVFLT